MILALAVCGAQMTANAADFALPSITVSSTGATVTGSTNVNTDKVVTTATTSAASAMSQIKAAAASVVSSSTSAASNVSSSVSSAESTTATPTFSLDAANAYVKDFTQVCSEAIAAYKAKDIMKASSLMPKVTDMYNKGAGIASSLTGGESKQFTDWKTSLMNAVKSAAGSLVK